MAQIVFNRERYLCTGRGFGNPDSFMTMFERWIEGTPVASPSPTVTGGAGWHIIDQTYRTTPYPGSTFRYIVVANKVAEDITSDPNNFTNPPMIIRIGYDTEIPSVVRIDGYLYFNPSTNSGQWRWFGCYLKTGDGVQFQYDFRGGPNFLSINTFINGDWDTMTLAPWEGDSRFVEGPSVAAPINSTVSAGTNVEVLFDSPATAANFSVGNFYYLYDFNDVRKVSYSKVSDLTTPAVYAAGKVILEQLRNSFDTGSVLTAYTHRFFVYYDNVYGSDIGGDGYAKIPYCSLPDTHSYIPYDRGRMCREARMNYNELLLIRENYDKYGNVATDIPFLYEIRNGSYPDDTSMNRVYGPVIEHYVSYNTVTSGFGDSILSRMDNGRVIDGNNYIYVVNTFQSSNKYIGSYANFAVLIPDYDYITT